MQVFLRIPYKHRRVAKAAGAHWSPSCKRWYVIDRISYRNCKQWHLPETPEVRAWLNDISLTKHYGEPTPNPMRNTACDNRGQLKSRTKTRERQERDLRKDRSRRAQETKYTQLRMGKAAARGNPGRNPASTFHGSSTEIHSVTVKLPL